ncbi:unnamed protein product, partial [Ixodes pacificus]
MGFPWKERTSSRRYRYASWASSSDSKVTYQLLLWANSQLRNWGHFSPSNRDSILTLTGVLSGISRRMRTHRLWFGRTFSPASSTWTFGDS